MKLTGAAILVSRGMRVLQAAPAAYPYRWAIKPQNRNQPQVHRTLNALSPFDRVSRNRLSLIDSSC